VFAHLAAGRVDDAVRLSTELVRRQPASAHAWHAFSEAAGTARRLVEATAAARRALALQPANTLLRAHLARCLLHQGLFRDATECADEVLRGRPRSPVTYDLIGQVYSGCEEHENAWRAFNTAVSLAPDTPHFLFNLATAYRNAGNFESAEGIYDRIIAASPDDWEAYKNRTDLRTQSSERNHIAELSQRLAEATRTWRGEVMVCAALAKEHEDLGDYSTSFRYLKRANAQRRAHQRYTVEDDVRAMRRIADYFSRKCFSREALSTQARGHDSEEPIFILGLPRTGSTLVERILGAHSQIFAAGELQHFPIALSRLAGKLPENAGSVDVRGFDLGRAALAVDPRDLGRSYVESTRPRTGHTRFFIDKFPSNFLFIGAIHRALPRARIIHVLRDPVDTCYAIFKTLFKDGYPYSYDLCELAAYYCAYRELMQHWRTALPGWIFEVTYEELVAAPTRVIAELLAFCDLGFEDDCLRFFENKAPASTASAAQVRQPMYRSSVGKWRHVAAELTPLLAALRERGIDVP
jgi:tetratricopeptide (TPR) repeat protein